MKCFRQFLAIPFVLCCFLAPSQNCKLIDGDYKVIYDKSFENYPSFEFQVNGNSIRELSNEATKHYLLKRLSSNTFRFEPIENTEDSLTDLQKKLIGNGDPFYEVIYCKKDTLTFINKINLHITSHSGRMVRIK
jgi:hypothetical protein